MTEQNPYACGDIGCILRRLGVPRQGTNGGCRCIPRHMTPEDRANLRQGIRWLSLRLAEAEGLVTPEGGGQ